MLKRGDIYLVNLDPVIGSEQGGLRPVLVIQNNIGNKYSPTCVVAAITSRCNKKFWLPTHIPIHCAQLDKESIVLLEQIRTIDKKRVGQFIGRISESDWADIDYALERSLGIHQINDRGNEKW